MKLLVFFCAGVAAAFLSFSASAAPSPQDASPSKIVSTLHLTNIFKAKSKWDVAVSQDDNGDKEIFDPPFFHLCFIQNDNKKYCRDGFYNISMNIFVVRAKSSKIPILVMQGASNPGGSALPTDTVAWIYSAAQDRFQQVFSKTSNASVNEEARIVSSGSLAGDVIVNTPTEHYPYPYDIAVYRISEAGRYGQILHYASRTRYNDGNALAVIDSEMPEIERRLHLWKPGDPLPRPLYLPARGSEDFPYHCGTLEMRHGTEWCRDAHLRLAQSEKNLP
jgi:hypothetical protein